MSIEECKDSLIEACKENGIKYKFEKKNDKLYQMDIECEGKKGLLRIFVTAKGIKLDDSQRDKELNNKVENLFYDKTNPQEVKQDTYAYKRLSNPIIKQVRDAIVNGFDNDVYEQIIRTNQNGEYIKIVNKITKEQCTVEFYGNGTICVKGLRWTLWTSVCSIIDIIVKPKLSEIIERLSGEDSNIKGDIICNAEGSVNIKLKEIIADNLLWDRSYDYIVSAQCMIDGKTPMKSYNPIIATLYIAVEGYLKNILTKLSIAKEIDINKSDWKFSSTFGGNRELLSQFHNKLNSDSIKSRKQKDGLKDLYMNIICYRHETCHVNGQPSINITKYHDAKRLYDEGIQLMTDSHSKIMKC